MSLTRQTRWMLPALAASLLLPVLAARADGDRVLQMTFAVRNGSGDNPMVAVWVESAEGEFVKTLRVFSKTLAYHRDLTAWRFKSKASEKDPGYDAITGATIKWGRQASLTVPVKTGDRDLLDGSYVLRIESRKFNGQHYRTFKIPLTKEFAGGKFEDAGYVASVEVAVKDAPKPEAK
jgi:hypothetical protein